MVMILYFLNAYIFIDRGYQLLAVGLFGLATYTSVLLLQQEFTRKYLGFLLDTFGIKKIGDNILKK